jgi:PAS domain S-box-containing protein
MWHKRQTPEATWLVGLFGGVAIWSLGYAMEMAVALREAKQFWTAFQYIVVVAVPGLWAGMAIEYTGRNRWLSKTKILAASIIPAITILLVWTNAYHELVRRDVQLVAWDTYHVLIVTAYGPWFWIHVGYCYLLLALGSILLLPTLFRSPHIYRRQIVVMLVGLLAPWVANAVYLFGFSPFPHLDLTPFSFIILCLACTLGLFRFQLIDIAPIARHLVVEELRDGVITLDPLDRIVDVNPVALRLLGRSVNQLVGRPAAEILEGISGLQFPLRGDDLSEEVVFERGGEALTYELRVTPLRDRHQPLPGHVIICHDINERKRTEAEIVRTQRLRAAGELSLGVSHNLNNILTGILGPAQNLRVAAGESEMSSQLDTIITSALRARDLIQRLSRSVEDEETAPRAVALGNAVKEAVEVTRPRWRDEARASGIQIEMITDLADVPMVAADPTGLHDLLLNLIFNAVAAMPDGGRIEIGSRPSEVGVCLTVQDTGTGMNEETRRRLFEPFFTTKTNVGTGLGLSTAYAEVNRWQGSIRVESAPGKGSLFIVELLLWNGPDPDPDSAPQPAPTRPDEPSAVASPTSSVTRVLVAEDEAIVSWMVTAALKNEGHEVVSTQDGAAALECFAPGRFDVAILDMGLPGLAGDELARQLRQIDPSVVTVLISGWNLGEGDVRLEAFDFYLRKPFGPSEVQDTVRQAEGLLASRSSPPWP